MKMKILEWKPGDGNDPRGNTHRCLILDGGRANTHMHIDLYTDATFPDEIDPQQLVGRTVEVEEIFPYSPFQFGRGVTVLDNHCSKG